MRPPRRNKGRCGLAYNLSNLGCGWRCQANRELVADEVGATAREDRRTANEACAMLLLLLTEGHLNRHRFVAMLAGSRSYCSQGDRERTPRHQRNQVSQGLGNLRCCEDGLESGRHLCHDGPVAGPWARPRWNMAQLKGRRANRVYIHLACEV